MTADNLLNVHLATKKHRMGETGRGKDAANPRVDIAIEIMDLAAVQAVIEELVFENERLRIVCDRVDALEREIAEVRQIRADLQETVVGFLDAMGDDLPEIYALQWMREKAGWESQELRPGRITT